MVGQSQMVRKFQNTQGKTADGRAGDCTYIGLLVGRQSYLHRGPVPTRSFNLLSSRAIIPGPFPRRGRPAASAPGQRSRNLRPLARATCAAAADDDAKGILLL